MSRGEAVVAAIAAGTAGLVACLLASWPAPQLWDSHTIIPMSFADVQAGMWWPRQVGDALLAGRNPFHATTLFWPVGQDVTLLVWNVLAELILWPLWQLVRPHAALNLAAYVAAALNGAAAGAAARRLGGDRWVELAAASLAGLSHFAFLEMVNGRIEQAMWAPVSLYLAELVAPERRPLRAALWLGLAASIYWFYGYFLLLVTLAWALGNRTRAAWLDVIRMGLGSLVVASPFLLPVALALAGGSALHHGDASLVATQATGSVPVPAGLWWPARMDPAFAAMAMPLTLLPGIVVGFLRGAGPARWLGAIGLATLLLSLGPQLVGERGADLAGDPVWMPHALLNLLPGMWRFWWCYRWLTLAIPAGILVSVLWLGRWRWALLVLVLAGGVETAALLRGGELSRRLPRHGVRPLPALSIVQEAPYPSPVLVLPPGEARTITVGWQAWFRQPTSAGLADHLPGVAPAGHQEAFAATGLGRVVAGGEPPAVWTEAETGGYRFVLLIFRNAGPGRPEPDAVTRELELRLTRGLGPPLTKNDAAAWWRVPG